MSTPFVLLAAMPFLTQEGPAPEDVKAGWLGFGVWIALAVAVALLSFSLRKHLKRVNFPVEGDKADDVATGGDEAPAGTNGQAPETDPQRRTDGS